MDNAMQPEGWTAIPNELLDKMGALGNAELRVLLALIRKTAGYQKESDRVSVSQLATMTGLTTRNAQAAIVKLMEGGFIGRDQVGKQSFAYHVKPYPVGTRLDHIPTGHGDETVSPKDTEPYPVGTRLTVKPYPVGTTQKKDSKQRKERVDDDASVVPPDPAPEARSKRKRPTDPNQAHPAVAVFYEKTSRRPNREQAHLIATQVEDVERWRGTLTFWLQRGWSATNVGGMVSRYQARDDRQPEQTEQSNGRLGTHQQARGGVVSNGTHPASSDPPAGSAERGKLRRARIDW